ncbi:Terpene synthase [Quillaja saponaria]|uniref:Terpene synthase n=1 Tax=Quillaja saponaria TaxID=32244 RepID=A0AAD7L2B4_QUISA|nr:Terpene synthase [Quillaja saponaria]
MEANKTFEDTTVTRPVASFKPPIWDYVFIQSLRSKYGEEHYVERRDMLMEKVKTMIDTVENPLHQLELIDVLQRFGLAYLFKEELKTNLDNIYNEYVVQSDTWKMNNLYAYWTSI